MLSLLVKKYFFCITLLLVLITLSFSGCDTTNNSDFGKAEILSFEIAEFPSASFSIDNNTGLIFIPEALIPEELSDESMTSLSAVFIVSEGASVFVGDSLQKSEIVKNDFSNGLTYTVVSEDGMVIKEYFVYLTRQVPKSYLLEGEIGIQVNPTGLVPLSAKAIINTKKDTYVTFVIQGDKELTNSNPEFSTYQEVGVHGLYPNTLNQVVFTLIDQNDVVVYDTVSIQTGALPDFFPEITIDVLNENLMESGLHFSELHIGNAGAFNSYPVMFDNNGNVRWYMNLSKFERIVWPIQFTSRNTFYAIFGVTFIEFDFLGNELRRLVVPQNEMHHEVIELPNRNLIIAVSQPNASIIKDGTEIQSVEDIIIEIDGNSGEILTTWDIAEILDINRTDVFDGGGDWFHMNAIWYDDRDKSLVISGRNQGVIKVDWDNNLKWILAAHQGWGNAGRTGEGEDTTPFLLTAIDQFDNPYSDVIQQGTEESLDFNWTWGQHTPMILPNGNLFVFDNGTNRNFGNASSSYSRAVEYEINENNMTIKQVWSYGVSRGAETFSNIISDVDYLPTTGNRLFSPGFITTTTPSQSKIIEIDPNTNDVVFESTFHFKNQLSTGVGWGNIDISYRAERISLY